MTEIIDIRPDRPGEVWFGQPAQDPTAGEVRSVSSTGAEKGVKPEALALVPVGPLLKLARHYHQGAKKYSKDNWRGGYEWSKSYEALMRHALAFWDGEDIDEETGSPHMAAVAFHAFALLEYMDTHPEFDDRYKPKPTPNGEVFFQKAA